MNTLEPAMCEDHTDLRPEQMRDDQLVAAYRTGDEAAADELFRRYYADLVKLAGKKMGWVLRTAEEDVDLAQTVFKSVFRRCRDGQIVMVPEQSLWPLLVTVLLHRVIPSRIRHYGRQCRDRHREVPLEDHDPLETGPSPQTVAKLHDLVEQVRKAFPPRRQEIIDYLLQGLPIQEIARRVGTSERVVYKTRQAFIRILEQILAES